MSIYKIEIFKNQRKRSGIYHIFNKQKSQNHEGTLSKLPKKLIDG